MILIVKAIVSPPGEIYNGDEKIVYDSHWNGRFYFEHKKSVCVQ